MHQNVAGATETEARACPRADIALTLCRACGFVFNKAFNPQLLRYSPGYENSQTCSSVFMNYLNSLVADLARRYELSGKRVVEVGCGQGTFLKRLQEVSGCTAVGFDPSYNFDGDAGHSCTFVESIYDPAHPDSSGDVVCARHVVEHLSQPVELIRDIRQALPDGSSAAWMETPRLEWILEHRAFWDVFYEHCSYFTMPALAALFTNHGFTVTNHRKTFVDQYQWIEARPSTGSGPGASGESASDALARELRAFADAWTSWRQEWHQRLRALARRGSCVVWGAGAKGVTFLNDVEAGVDTVQAVVDVNPRKQGRFVAGTGQPIIRPDQVRGIGARTVVVMNANYLEEIRDCLRREDCDCSVLVLERPSEELN